jgi:hypothetical protein
MSAAALTQERNIRASDEMINAFLTLVSLTNKYSMPETITKYPVVEYEILMNSLIDEYDKKI